MIFQREMFSASVRKPEVANFHVGKFHIETQNCCSLLENSKFKARFKVKVGKPEKNKKRLRVLDRLTITTLPLILKHA